MGQRILNADGEWVEPKPGPKSRPVRQEGPGSWGLVRLGLLVKLVALTGGVLGVAGCAVAACLGPGTAAALTPLAWRAGGMVAVALVLDAAGRLLCLRTPEAATRPTIVLSVVCQAVAVASLGAAAAGQEWEITGLLTAFTFQCLSAHLFVGYLLGLTRHFKQNALTALAAGAHAGLLVFAVVGGLLLVTAGILYAIYLALGIVLVLFPAGGLGALLGLGAASVVLAPLAVVAALALLGTYGFYGAVLVGLLGRVGRGTPKPEGL